MHYEHCPTLSDAGIHVMPCPLLSSFFVLALFQWQTECPREATMHPCIHDYLNASLLSHVAAVVQIIWGVDVLPPAWCRQ